MVQFSKKATMPDPVEDFAFITKYHTDFFAFVQCLAKCILHVS